MFGDMLGKLQEAKKKVEEAKTRLDSITVEGEAGDGAVRVVSTGNRKINNIEISDELLKKDKDEIQDLLLTAVNRALEKADNVNESEMQSAAMGVLPNIPGIS